MLNSIFRVSLNHIISLGVWDARISLVIPVGMHGQHLAPLIAERSMFFISKN